jgi:hypothetical protein
MDFYKIDPRLGFRSGKVVALRHTFKHRELAFEVHADDSDSHVALFAHRGAVSDIAPCLEFGVAVSASADARCRSYDYLFYYVSS